MSVGDQWHLCLQVFTKPGGCTTFHECLSEGNWDWGSLIVIFQRWIMSQIVLERKEGNAPLTTQTFGNRLRTLHSNLPTRSPQCDILRLAKCKLHFCSSFCFCRCQLRVRLNQRPQQIHGRRTKLRSETWISSGPRQPEQKTSIKQSLIMVMMPMRCRQPARGLRASTRSPP